jgi:putative salt-induced outer membrane protein YdiY
MKRTTRLLILTLTACTFAAGAARAADEPKRPWSDTADFGLVLTTGNAESTNFALSNKFKYSWSNAELSFDAAALRNESTTTTLTNVDGTVTETESTAVTASLYALALKYRRDISPRFYWFVASSWYQNFFAGVDDRYIAGGGLGYVFVKEPRHLLRGEAGFDYTREDPLGNPVPGVPATDVLETTDYASLHLFLGYEFKISETAKLTEDLNFNDSLDTTSDWRALSVTAVTASLTSKLAIKVSYTVGYDNRPAERVVLDSVGPVLTDVSVPFEKTDTILAAALVVNF